MKLKGKEIGKPADEVVVIPREGGNIVFKAQPILDYSEFEKICPEPEPQIKVFADGRRETNAGTPEFEKLMTEWYTKRASWMFITSISATEGLEWDKVDIGKPETWNDYKVELSESGLTAGEIGALTDTVVKACGLDQTKIEEATESFLATQQAKLDE